MSDKKKLANRIPFESLEKESAVAAWSLPAMDRQSRRVYSAKREQDAKKAKPAGQESVEDYKSPVKPKPLTAQDLQKLASEAKQEGYDSGYQEGLQKGLSEGTARGLQEGEKKAFTETRQQLQDEIARLALIRENLFAPMEQQACELENIIVDMALHFTKELIAKEISETPLHLVSLVKKALIALPAGAKNISVFCNEKDAALIQKYCPKDNRNWIIKVDDTIARGGCRVETLESLVDYTVDHRLQAFLQQVQEKGEVDAGMLPAAKDYASELAAASHETPDTKSDTRPDEKAEQDQVQTSQTAPTEACDEPDAAAPNLSAPKPLAPKPLGPKKAQEIDQQHPHDTTGD